MAGPAPVKAGSLCFLQQYPLVFAHKCPSDVIPSPRGVPPTFGAL